MTDDVPDIEVQHSLRSRLTEQFDSELVDAAADIIPQFNQGEQAPEYRVAVAREFIELSENSQKQNENPLEDPDKSALVRAFTCVAAANGITETGIRGPCVHAVYEGGDEEQTAQFREDLKEIRTRLKQ
ncbi:hypothetical protein [Halobaculum roseum]|uniref:Uncharacterized protein n=1 Tax=Halobaculum roseum TaxID=2175149 RepID=A0ABD5MIR6_9EURY|nr:hypothetical protein [Halobaculum roseum]QZY04232.1 hypothetical protein K6T36_16085 [Halobaculum roseum]